MFSFDCSSYMQVPITTNNDAHSRYVSPFLEKNYAGFGSSFWRETKAPEGVQQDSPGRKPGFKVQIAESPERAAQGFGLQLQINARHKAPALIPPPLHRP